MSSRRYATYYIVVDVHTHVYPYIRYTKSNSRSLHCEHYYPAWRVQWREKYQMESPFVEQLTDGLLAWLSHHP